MVKQIESYKMVAAMNKHTLSVIYALYKNEGHSYKNFYNRISYHIIIEQFLAKYLGGRAEPVHNRYVKNYPNLLLEGNF